MTEKKKKIVFLPGASGSMGFCAFKLLWNRKIAGEIDLVLLQRPSRSNKEMFAPYEKQCGITSIPREGTVQGNGLKIIWGDATNYDDVLEAVKGIDGKRIDVCLCPMAVISPAADRHPKMAKAVNTNAIIHIVKAIEAIDKENIVFIYTGTVAETGDRLPPIHHGRIGDPMKPSIFDFYATTKIQGERAVCESSIKHWVSLRQTFIMIPNVFDLQDPIMFHQPLNSFMENNTSADAGRGLVNCLDVPLDSDFWRRCYNMAGIDYRKVMDRKWFALRNFHMQFYEDSWVLNEYVHNWGESLADYREQMKAAIPTGLKAVARLCKILPPFKKIVELAAYNKLKKLAEQPDGTLGWINRKNDMRITAFYKSYEDYENIPNWDIDMPCMNHDLEFERLDHGYDETKEQLDLHDLRKAAVFRGGDCISTEWDGDLYTTLKWRCGIENEFGIDHEFEAKPYTVLKAGIWCAECLAPPWDYDTLAKKNKFFAQIWYNNHDVSENNFYPAHCYQDIEES